MRNELVILPIIMLILTMGCTGGSTDTSDNPASTPAADHSTVVDTAPINQAVTIGSVVYLVQKAQTFTRMGSEYYDTYADGKYVKVYLKITNNGADRISFLAPIIKIQDGSGNTYEESDGYIAYVGDPLMLGQALEPGKSVEGGMVFELPSNAANLKLIIRGDVVASSQSVVELSHIADIGEDTTLQAKHDALVNKQ